MKKLFVVLLAGVILMSACGASGDIEIYDPWARPAVQGENTAVYFQIQNHSQNADELIGASSDLSDNVEIHESKMENDVMHMEMISSLSLDTGEEVNFEPGGYHVMMVNIKQEIKAGDHIGIILHFKNHDDIVVNASVGNAPAGSDDMENMDHQ